MRTLALVAATAALALALAAAPAPAAAAPQCVATAAVGKPANLRVRSVTDESAVVTWDPPAGSACVDTFSYYLVRVEARVGQGSVAGVAATQSPTDGADGKAKDDTPEARATIKCARRRRRTTYAATLDNLDPRTTYRIAVSAGNRLGPGNDTSTTFTTRPSKPGVGVGAPPPSTTTLTQPPPAPCSCSCPVCAPPAAAPPRAAGQQVATPAVMRKP